jgi:hypothetical protein
MLHVPFGLTVDELESCKDFNPILGMLLATVTAAKSAQIYPNLSKFAKICPKTISLGTLKCHQKLRF